MADPRFCEVHVFRCRVYYEDTDAAGVVYYANYLKYAERARSEMLRRLGTDNTKLLGEHGVQFAVRDCAVTYRRPARLDDALEVHTRIMGVGRATLSAEQTVKRAEEIIADLSVRLACLDSEGRPARLPQDIRSAFESMKQRH
jgi:acyl-CoA thioester hydrolase